MYIFTFILVINTYFSLFHNSLLSMKRVVEERQLRGGWGGGAGEGGQRGERVAA